MNAVLSAAAAALGTLAVLALGRPLGLFRPARNFEGRDVPVAGLAVAAGMAAGIAAVLLTGPAGSVAAERAAIAAAAGFALAGFLDDRYGDRSASGFRGHLGALRGGRVTTGALKILLGGAAALCAAWLLGARGAWWIGEAAVIALCANALNLLDTRPVRAVAAFLVLGLFAWPSAPVVGCAALPAALAWLPFDRRRRGMLGDAGSNALGAVLGVMVMAEATSATVLGALAALVAFHVYTEGHSVNRAIAAHPRLNRLDEWIRGGADDVGVMSGPA